MNIFELPIRRRVLTTVLVLIAVIMGGLAYVGLGLRRFPEIEFPMAVVTTVYSGADPEKIETEVTERIEDSVRSIAGIESITSYSQQAISMVLIEFGLEEDIDVKAQDVRDKLDLIGRDLPEDAEDPIVQKFDISQMPVLTLALIGPQDVNELYRLADEELEDLLSGVKGVARVELTGGQLREIQVLLDAEKLRKHRVSPAEVEAAIRSHNADIPVGYITESEREYSVRVRVRFTDIEQIMQVPVPVGDAMLEVRHLGEVIDTFEEARTRSRADRQNSIILTVQQESGANEVEVVDGVLAKLPKLEPLLPPDAKLIVASDDSVFIRGALANVRTNMLIAIALTAVTVFLFLGSWRGTVIVGVVMPASVIMTFLFLEFSGFTLNILTLVALALSIGTLVNNAILVLENTTRFIDEGLSPLKAAAEGTKDVALPILSSTATNLVVFMPIAFMGEIIGMFFKEFGLTIVYLTVASLLISYTLTPMMCALLLGRKGGVLNGLFNALDFPFRGVTWVWNWCFNLLKALYLGLLDWCLRWWPVPLGLTAAMFVGSLVVMGRVIGSEFFPRSDEGLLRVTVETPLGTSLDVTDERVREVEQVVWEEIVNEAPDRRHYYSRVGSVSGFLGSASSGTHLASIDVVVEDKIEREEEIDDFLARIRPRLAHVPSAKVIAAPGAHGPGGSAVEIEITGKDLGDLRRISGQVASIIERVPGTSNVDLSWRAGQPEIQVLPLKEREPQRQLSAQDIGLGLRSYVDGREAGQFRDRGEDYDIIIKLAEEDRSLAEDVRGMFIRSPKTGEMIAATSVSEIRREVGPSVITRKDGQRLISVTADLTGQRPLGDVMGDVRRLIGAEVSLPPETRIDYGGETEMMVKNFKELFKAMAQAVILTFLSTAGIIESFLLAGIIFMSIPASVVGVALAMLIWGSNMNVFSLMAMVMLVGMLVNNAIIIVDYATRPERRHLSPAQRIREACAVRFRVIVMANLTTIVALIPLSLGIGFAGEVFQPLAVVIIGGIVASTTLALVIIPVLYRVLEDIRGFLTRKPETA